jgi:aspartate/glutamate racemase
MKRLAFIHTAPWHAERFQSLARRKLQGWSSYAVVDESLLLDTIERGVVSPKTVKRLTGYVRAAADAGASAVVVTCSTLGYAVDAMRSSAPVPLFRIDRGMAVEAVRRARRIGVLATLSTTLFPTTALITEEAAAVGARCEVSEHLCEGAFAMLMAGDRAAYEESVRIGFSVLAAGVDLVVLAQASMADAMDGDAHCPYLTSPEIGMDHVARQLATV